MCGRFTLTLDEKEFYNSYGLSISGLKPRYNIAPSQICPIISMVNGQKQIAKMFWGLPPLFKSGYNLINARAETIHSKPTFKKLFLNQRCLVPSNGFFEWKKIDKSKIPYRIILKNEKPFTFAGIFSREVDKNGKVLESFAILTTHANSLLEKLHDRMPVILNQKDELIWLNNQELPTEDKFNKIITPYSSNKMHLYEVSPIVNSWKNDDISCINPL